jgi:hypothetical protein
MEHNTFLKVTMVVLVYGAFFVVQVGAIPHLINYQGDLTDPNGEPISDPYLPVVLTFYDAAVGGSNLFSESHNVDVNDGLFTLLIGSQSGPGGIPEAVFAGEDVYLGIRVGDDSEMTPRQRVTSAAFAYRAEKADDAELLGGLASSDYAWSIHAHDDWYYTESEINSLFYTRSEIDSMFYTKSLIDSMFYTNSQIDSMFYTKSQINSMFYTKSQIDSMFYTKADLDPRLLTSGEKSELTGAGVTSLHYHPTGQLEAWPSNLVYEAHGWHDGSSLLFGEFSVSKIPGSAILRINSLCLSYDTSSYGIRIETSLGDREHNPAVVGEWAEYEDLYDITGEDDYDEIWIKLYISGGVLGTRADVYVYTQQNAP